MNTEVATEKLKNAYDECLKKIKELSEKAEKSGNDLIGFVRTKRVKFYIAIACFVQAVTFVVLFMAFWNKNKGIAGLFGALAAAGAAVGSLLLISSLDTDEQGKKTLLNISGCCDDEEEIGDDISVEIVDEGEEEIKVGEEDK